MDYFLTVQSLKKKHWTEESYKLNVCSQKRDRKVLFLLTNNDFLAVFEFGSRVTICGKPEGEVLGGIHYLKSTGVEEKAPY